MNTITAKCAYCGKEATYTLDDDEFIMLQLYLCFGRQLGNIQDIFPKVPPWIRSGAIDLYSDGFCICPDCCQRKTESIE